MLCLCVEFGLLVEWFELIVGERGFVYIKVNGINGILLECCLDEFLGIFGVFVLVCWYIILKVYKI